MARRDKIRVYFSRKGDWRWTRKSPNGTIVGASTQGYSRRIDAVRNLERNSGAPLVITFRHGRSYAQGHISQGGVEVYVEVVG